MAQQITERPKTIERLRTPAQEDQKPDKKAKRRKTRRSFLIAGALALLTIAGHFPSQIRYMNNTRPTSAQREAFERLFCPIYGFKEDIEESDGKLSMIAEAVNRTRIQQGWTPEYIEVISPDYSRKNAFRQAESLYPNSKNLAGKCRDQKVFLYAPDFTLNHIYHELGHAFFNRIKDENPNAIEEFKSLSTDEHGRSLYLNTDTSDEAEISRLEKIAIERGFINHQAMKKNPEEGTEEWAETAALAATDPSQFHKRLYEEKNSNGNKRLIKKIKFLQDIGLIPKEFSSAVEIINLGEFHPGGKSEGYLEKSQDFLNIHPNSVYNCRIHNDRGRHYHRLAQNTSDNPTRQKELAERAIEELKMSLQVPYRPSRFYESALSQLAIIHTTILKDNNTADQFRATRDEHKRRFSSNDPTLSVDGAYLRERSVAYLSL